MYSRNFQTLSLLLSLPLASCLSGIIENLKESYPEWQPNAIIDIGANQGAWSEEARFYFPNAKLLLLEATPKHEDKLKEVTMELGNAEYQINVLTGKTGDTVEFFQDGNTGNSMFRENSKHYADSKSVKRTTITLDDAISASHIKQNGGMDSSVVDFIKIDVQGAELLVLEGGSKALAEASFVQVESSSTEYNSGGACFYEVDEFLRSHGFFMYDAEDVEKSEAFKTLGWGQWDTLYVRPSSDRLPDKFKELKGTYCGMGRNTGSSTRTQQNSFHGEVENFDILSLWNLISCAIFGILGFFVGRTEFLRRKPARNRL